MAHACALYVSTAAKASLNKLYQVATKLEHATPNLKLVDLFRDEKYARSSVKLVGTKAELLDAAAAVAKLAHQIVDLTDEPHPAPHPRQGALDMVAFMPLSTAKSSELEPELDECSLLAHELGDILGHQGLPVLLYGPRRGRSLLATRRLTSFFESTKSGSQPEPWCTATPDFGPAGGISPRTGVAVVGAMPYVTNYNVQVADASLAACRTAAAALRAGMGVQLMALPHDEGTVEIGCNLQATAERDSQDMGVILSELKRHLPPEATVRYDRVIGLTPDECLRRWHGGDFEVCRFS